MGRIIFEEPQATLGEITCNGEAGYALQSQLLLCKRCFADLPLAVVVSGGDLQNFIVQALSEAMRKHCGPTDHNDHGG